MEEKDTNVLELMTQLLSNIQFNVAQLVQNQSQAVDVAAMRKELEIYRSDSIMKLMRNYGIDALIKTYIEICTRIFEIENNLDEDTGDLDVQTLRWTLNRLEKKFKSLGIKMSSSDYGDEFDGAKMEIFGNDEYDEDAVLPPAPKPEFVNRVKKSIVPAFIWNIPSLNGTTDKIWYLEREKVTMFR